jgi:hypothetical protein
MIIKTLHNISKCSLLIGVFTLASCASKDSGTIVYSGSGAEEDAVPAEESLYSNDPFVRQRILADMLYEARVAYEDNRLMSPSGNNAYAGFRAVLDFEPDNEVALQGIRDIVQRYVELADAAIKIGQYENAQSYLDRGASLRVNSSVVSDARRQLEQARETKMSIFTLDAEGLAEQSLEIMVELGEIGQYIRNIEATFLINARTDEEGRWIYKIMREAVGGYRLRGNIGVANEPSIQVVIPKT